MKRNLALHGVVALLTLMLSAAIPADDLEATMEVMDDLSALDGEFVITDGTDDENYEEDLFDLDDDGIPDDQEDETGLFDQYTELGNDFEIDDENDGFEHDNEDVIAEKAFEQEDELEPGEDVDTDEYDVIDDTTGETAGMDIGADDLNDSRAVRAGPRMAPTR